MILFCFFCFQKDLTKQTALVRAFDFKFDTVIITITTGPPFLFAVTEHEARNGVLPGTQALAFLRELQGLDGGRLMDSMAHRHKEVITQEDGQVGLVI